MEPHDILEPAFRHLTDVCAYLSDELQPRELRHMVQSYVEDILDFEQELFSIYFNSSQVAHGSAGMSAPLVKSGANSAR